MKRRGFIYVLGRIASGFWPRRRTIIAGMAAMALLPIEASDAGWLSDLFKGSSKQVKSPKQATIAKPRHLAQASRPGETCRLAEAPCRKAGRPRARSHLSRVRVETGSNPCDALEVPDRSGCGAYRRIGRRHQRPQRFRVCLQSAPCETDRGEAEGRRLCRDQIAADRGQGQAQPRQARRRGQRSARQSLPVDPPRLPCPTNSSRTGNSREGKAVSATASAAIPCSSPATIRTSRRASRSPN